MREYDEVEQLMSYTGGRIWIPLSMSTSDTNSLYEVGLFWK